MPRFLALSHAARWLAGLMIVAVTTTATAGQANTGPTLDSTALISLDIKFPSGLATLYPGYEIDLAEIARVMRHYDDLIVVLEGHADDRGSALDNALLSRARAQVVRRELLAMGGIEPSRVLAVGYGESSPLASNGDINGRLLNRRVVAEIRMRQTVVAPTD